MIKNGADVNATDDDGHTALHFAVNGGYEETVRFLLEHKANVNAKTKTFGSTPLNFLKEHSPIVGYLLKKYGAVSSRH